MHNHIFCSLTDRVKRGKILGKNQVFFIFICCNYPKNQHPEAWIKFESPFFTENCKKFDIWVVKNWEIFYNFHKNVIGNRFLARLQQKINGRGSNNNYLWTYIIFKVCILKLKKWSWKQLKCPIIWKLSITIQCLYLRRMKSVGSWNKNDPFLETGKMALIR